VTVVFISFFLLQKFFYTSSRPKTLRRYLESCGGTFIKLGQFLAMRFDVLPTVYYQELSSLLDSLAPIETSRIIEIIEDELGKPLPDCFHDFNLVPLSSASVSQVHDATLLSGEKVVVKVKRPHIDLLYRIDFINFRLLVRILDRAGLFGEINLSRLMSEFIRLAQEELNFADEARNIELLHKLMLEDVLDHYAPKVYLSLSSPSVITIEKLEGVWLKDFINAILADDRTQLAVWRADGITPKRTARLLLRSILVQCFSYRFYHADPHVANLVVLPGGTLAYVDFGMVGWLDERSWSQQFKLRQFITNNMLHAAYETLLDILEPIPDKDLSFFEFEIKTSMRQYILSSKQKDATLLDKSISYLFFRICDAVRRERLSMPTSALRLYKAISIADMVMLRLYPDIDWMTEIKEFIDEESAKELNALLEREQIQATVNTLLLNLLNAPQTIGDLLDWTQHRLPELGRSYKKQLTIFEHVVFLIFGYSQMLLVVFGAAVLISGFRALRDYVPFLGKIYDQLNGWWWVLGGLSLLLAFMLSRILKRMKVE
jgi:ubiquinone biosynthesis protein